MSYNVKDIRDYGVQAGILQTTQIQAAFNTAAGAEAIWFPPGLEFISGPLTLRSNLILLGAGVESVLSFERNNPSGDEWAFTADGATYHPRATM